MKPLVSGRGAGALIAAAIAFAPPAVGADRSIALPADARFPENVAAAADGTLFVSSFTDGGVLRVTPDGSTPAPFFKPGDHGTRSTFGLLVDPKSGTLWVASNDVSTLGVKGPGDVDGAWVKGFDLTSGALKLSAKLPAAPAVANDFAVGDDGTLYVTNTAGNQIFRLRPTAKELDVFVADDRLKGGLDGIAFGEDGALYVTAYRSGELFRIDMKLGEAGPITKLETSRPLVRPDGLRAFGRGFLMAEGGGDVSRVTIEGNRATLETLGRFEGPTGVAVAAGRVWVSEGKLARLKERDRPGAAALTFRLGSTPLPEQ